MTKLDKSRLDELRKESFENPTSFITAADRWLRENGIITPVLHNNIILNLYVNFPKAELVEYYMDPESKEIEVHLHFRLVQFLLNKESTLERRTKELISQYLPNYRVTAKKRRFEPTGRDQTSDSSKKEEKAE